MTRVLALVALLLPRAMTANPCTLTGDEWKAVNGGTTIVRLHRLSGQTLHEGVAIATFAVPADQVVRVVTDYDNFARFMPYVRHSRVDGREPGRVRHREELNLPLLLRDRYYRVWASLPITTTVNGRTETTVRWEYEPGSGNIVTTGGSWTITTLAPNRSVACYRVRADIDAPLPDWVTNIVTRVALPDVITRIRTEIRRRQTAATGPIPSSR